MICMHAIYGNADRYWIATHSQMSKMWMRKQTQKRISAGFANVGVRLDAPWRVQPHNSYLQIS